MLLTCTCFTPQEAAIARKIGEGLDYTDGDSNGVIDLVLTGPESLALRALAAKIVAGVPK